MYIALTGMQHAGKQYQEMLKYVYRLRNSKEKQRIFWPNPSCLACEQAFWGVPPVGWEKEGELATTSLDYEHLHRKSRCKMLIGGDDISNDLHVFSYVCLILARFPFALIGGILTAKSMGSHGGIGGRIQIPETLLQALLPFPAPPPERPGELARRLELPQASVLKRG